MPLNFYPYLMAPKENDVFVEELGFSEDAAQGHSPQAQGLGFWPEPYQPPQRISPHR